MRYNFKYNSNISPFEDVLHVELPNEPVYITYSDDIQTTLPVLNLTVVAYLHSSNRPLAIGETIALRSNSFRSFLVTIDGNTEHFSITMTTYRDVNGQHILIMTNRECWLQNIEISEDVFNPNNYWLNPNNPNNIIDRLIIRPDFPDIPIITPTVVVTEDDDNYYYKRKEG